MEQSLDPALFNMLPKKMRHTQPANFQPMANKHSCCSAGKSKINLISRQLIFQCGLQT